MSETALLYACGILLTRVVYLPNDERLSWWASALQAAAQIVLVLILFEFSRPIMALIALLSVVASLAFLLETSERVRSGMRLLTLGAQLSPVLILWQFGFFEPRYPGVGEPTLLLPFLGLLLLANEANYLVRLLFNWCGLTPKLPVIAGEPQKVDEEEYKAGRVIGMLERVLIFLIVYFTSDLSAVGFILAAKGVIRIRQLRDRQFSEYMLIGTLASVTCAVAVAFALQ